MKVRKPSTPGTGASAPAATSSPKAESGPGNAAVAQEVAAQGAQSPGEQVPYIDKAEVAMGVDLSGVRIHTGPEAQEAAASLNAKAVTQGDDIMVGERGADERLIAHELTHVAMQRAGVAPASGEGEKGDAHEQHADEVAERVVAGESAADLLHDEGLGPASTTARPAVQREDLEEKVVSSKAMARLGAARRGIDHTKSVIDQGAGNQYTALTYTNFNSYFRMACMRDPECWELDPRLYDIARAHPEALTAAKADLAGGGNCGEHAAVAFDYLRRTGGDTVNKAAKAGLDHAFVIIGDLSSDSDQDLVVSDPWPYSATACLWEDHFAYTSDRSKINVSNTVSEGDGSDAKAALAAGLKLSKKGEQMITQAFDEERTKEELDKGTEGDHPWIWQHADAASEKYDYVEEPKPEEEVEPAGPDETPRPEVQEEEEAPAPIQQEEQADTGWSRFMGWLRSWL